MCIDYIDLKKACLKDNYPFLQIDQRVNATSSHELLTFVDAFSKYNKIRLALQDKKYTSFITNQGIYYYRVMPLGFKNMQMVNKIFKHQIERDIEVYVDVMIVKSKTIDSHFTDLVETF